MCNLKSRFFAIRFCKKFIKKIGISCKNLDFTDVSDCLKSHFFAIPTATIKSMNNDPEIQGFFAEIQLFCWNLYFLHKIQLFCKTRWRGPWSISFELSNLDTFIDITRYVVFMEYIDFAGPFLAASARKSCLLLCSILLESLVQLKSCVIQRGHTPAEQRLVFWSELWLKPPWGLDLRWGPKMHLENIISSCFGTRALICS